MLDAFELLCRKLDRDNEDANQQRIQEAFSKCEFLRAASFCFSELERTSTDDLDRLSLLVSLAHFSQRLFQIYDPDLWYLDEAEEHILQAIDLATRKNIDMSLATVSLAYNYVLRSSFTLEIEDANKALEYGQQAMETAIKKTECEGQADKYWSKGKSGVYVAIKAIDLGQHSIKAATESHYLSLLESILCHQSLRAKQVADLQLDVQDLRVALERLPQENLNERVGLLNNISHKYGSIFVRERSRSHIDLAVEYGEQAADLLKKAGHSNFPQRGALRITFRHGHHQTLSRTSTQDCIKVLLNLARSYELLSSVSHEAADEDQAIRCQQQVNRMTSPKDPQRFLYLTHLASLLRIRSRRTGYLRDIDAAISCMDEALRCQPEDCDSQAFLHFRRGALYQNRADALREKADQDNAVLAFLDGFASAGTPLSRLSCAYRALMICGARDRFFAGYLRCSLWPLLVDIIEPVLELLSADFHRANSRDDGREIQRIIHGLPSSVASLVSTVTEEPVRVIGALEACRGIIASMRFDVKLNLRKGQTTRFGYALDAARTWVHNHPSVWYQYSDGHDSPRAMNTTSVTTGSNLYYSAEVEAHETLGSSLTGRRGNTSSVTGEERFILPPTANKMMEMAREGAIVTFVITPLKSAALLVTPSSIKVLTLHDLHYADVRRWSQIHWSNSNPSRRNAELCEEDEEDETEKQKEQGSHGPAAETDLEDILRKLWDVAVKTILLQLQGQRDRNGKLPRIWWVGGGIMRSLPFHAAGYHDVGSTENTLSHAVSSYALTMKKLQFSLENPPLSLSSVNGALAVVSMPTTPGGYAPLNIAEEVQAIRHSMSSFWSSITILERPNKKDVLNALRSCSAIHFACHGIADRVEPQNSALLIGRDNVEKLTAKDLNLASSNYPGIVYLSACSTAETGGLVDDKDAADTHLISAFQNVLFAHAVGTLWGADDHAAAEVAKNFYGGLKDHTEDGYIAVARALHDAMLSFRDKGQNRKDLAKWAPFVHFGS